MMLYSLSVFISDIILNSDHSKKLGEDSVSLVYSFGNFYSLLCKAHSSIFFVSEESFLIKLLHHTCDTRRRNIEIIRNINSRHITLLMDKFVDYFKIIFHPVCATPSYYSVGVTNGCKPCA